MLVGGVEPIKEISSGHAIELNQVANQMFVDYGSLDSADGVFFQDCFGFFRIPDVGDIFPVDGVKVTPFDPAVIKSGFFQCGCRVFIGGKDQAGRM